VLRPIVALAFLLPAATLAAERADEVTEVPITVPSTVPVGFLVAWKPTFLSVRVDSGAGAEFGSDKFQPLRGLFRYTNTLFGEKLLWRAEVEGGEFASDTQGALRGSDGFDVTARILGGTATRISPGFIITASAGFLSRYQRGSAANTGAPRIGMFGVTSNLELEYRIAPVLSVSGYIEGGLAPLSYDSQANLGTLRDASEFRVRLQFSVDVNPNTDVDIGYDFTRWHAAFTGSSVLNPAASADRALLIEAREHAITIGVRWKP
jgi:hypothetical protein